MEAANAQDVGSGVQISEDRANGRIVWRITQGESSLRSNAATVTLRLPVISNYSAEPITYGDVSIQTDRYVGYGRGIENIKPEVAAALGEALSMAAVEAQKEYERLKPQVADLIEKRAKEREEREAKNKKSKEIRDEIQAVRKKWLLEAEELLAWYEGQPGRLQRKGKKAWDVFDELGHITVPEHGTSSRIYWIWHGERFSHGAGLEDIGKIEIKYQGEREFDRIDLPKYPQAEINKLQKKLMEL